MHAAAEVIAGEVMQGNEELAQKLQPAALNARVIPSVAYTGPGVAWVGLAAYFSPSWTAFQADRGRYFSVIVDGISN